MARTVAVDDEDWPANHIDEMAGCQNTRATLVANPNRKQQTEDAMRQVSKIGMTLLAVAVAATAVVAGCTRIALRTEAATSGIRAAEEVGAANVPQAKLHLQLAKEELAAAKALAVNDEKEQAASMLLRAEADAELAVALSRENTARTEARTAVEMVRKLQLDNK